MFDRSADLDVRLRKDGLADEAVMRDVEVVHEQPGRPARLERWKAGGLSQ